MTFLAFWWAAALIDGIVRDAVSSEPLANVRFEAKAGTAVSGADGRFEVTAEPGETIRITLVGYRPERVVVEGAATLAVTLTPDNLTRREKLTVTVDPFEASLTGGEIKNLSSVLADDPLRAVQSLPGVAANNDFVAQFSVRGASFQRVGIYLDGILLRSPFHTVQNEPSTGSLTIFNGDLVETMTLHSGVPPAPFSDRTAAALDVQLREGSRLRPAVRLTAGAAGAGALAEGPLNRKGTASWLVGVRKSYLQYLLSRATNDTTLAFDFFDTQGKLAWSPSERQTLSLGFFDGISGLDRTSARARLGVNGLMESAYRSTLLNLAWQFRSANRWLTTQRVAYLRERSENTNRDQLPLGRGFGGEWVARTDTSYRGAQFGGSMRRLREEGALTRYQTSPLAVLTRDRYRGTGWRAGGYGQQTVQWQRLRMTAGGRWDHMERTAWSPQLGASYQLREGTRVQGGWGQAVQFPNFLQGMRLLPERATHLTVAVEQMLGDRTRLRVETYRRWDRDQIFRPFEEPRLVANGSIFNPPLVLAFQNSQRATARGVEVTLQRRSANRLSGWVSYGYGRTTVRDGALGIQFPGDFDQRHTANIYGSYRIRPTLNISSRYSYGSNFPVAGFYEARGSQYFLAAGRNGLRLRAYQRADLRLNKSFTWQKWRSTLFVEVQNLTNVNNRRLDSINGYNNRTGQAFLTFGRLFPIVPAAGVMFEWER